MAATILGPASAAPAPSPGAVAPLAASTAGRTAAPGKGIACMLLAVGLFAVMDALVKWLGETYPTVQLFFFRSAFAFIPLGIVIAWRGRWSSAIKVTNGWGHVLRSLIGMGAMGIFFYCFPRMPLADMIAITFAAPIFIVALSVPLLGEKVGPRRWSAVLVGFIGVMIILQPGGGGFESIALLALFGTVFYALAAISVRWLSRTETSTSIVFTFTLSCTLVSAALLPFGWVTPSLPDLALLICIGLIGGAAQVAMTDAFRHADVSLVVPFEYSAMIWAALLGFLFWGEIPGNNLWIGCAILVCSGLYILYREASLGLPRGTARKLHTRR